MSSDPFHEANAETRRSNRVSYEDILRIRDEGQDDVRRQRGVEAGTIGSLDSQREKEYPLAHLGTPDNELSGNEARSAGEPGVMDIKPVLWDVYKGTLAENWMGIKGAVEFADEFFDDLEDGAREWDALNRSRFGEHVASGGTVHGGSPAWMHEAQQDGNVAADVFGAVESAIPDMAEPETVTGTILREFSKFATAMMLMRSPASGLVGKTALTGRTAVVATDVVAGGMASTILRAETNLFNMVDGTALENPVTSYLATDEDDPEAVNRIKNAVVDMGFGALTGSLVPLVRALRNAKRAWRAGGEGGDLIQEAMEKGKLAPLAEADVDDAFRPIRDADSGRDAAAQRLAERMRVADNLTPGEADQIADRLAVEVDEAFNFSRIESVEDVDEALRSVLGANFDAVAEGQAWGRSLGMVADEAADAPQLTLREVLSRVDGDLWGDVKTLQARNLLMDLTERTNQLAIRATGPNAGDVDLFAWRKMEAVTAAVAERVLNLRADQSRALGQWRIHAKGDPMRAIAMDEVLRSAGGKDELLEIARRKAELLRRGIDVPPMHQDITGLQKFGEGATKLAINGMLFQTGAHFKNVLSGVMVALQEPVERFAAEGIRALKGSVDDVGVERGEAAIMAKATVMALGDAFSAAKKAWSDGQSTFGALARQKLDVDASRPMFADTFDNATTMGRVGNFLSNVHSASSRALMTTDEFFKMIGYRAEVHALALRTVQQEARRAGKVLDADTMAARIKAIVDDPPDDLRLSAVTAANYRTFTDEADGMVAGMMRWGRAHDPSHFMFATHVAPFINTPSRALSYSFERFPLPGFAYISKTMRHELRAGGARADIAQARMAVGFAIGGVMLDAAMNDRISGPRPKDPGEARVRENAGYRYESIFVPGEDGGQWVSYGFMDQYAGQLAFAGEISRVLREKQIHPESYNQVQEVVSALGMAVISGTFDRAYMQGAADLMEVLSGRVQDGRLRHYLNQRAQAHVPFSGLLKQTERAYSPEIEAVPGFPILAGVMGEEGSFDFLRAMVAEWSDSLPDRIGIDGEPINSEPVNHAVSSLVPVRFGPHLDNVAPFAKEMDRLGMRWDPMPVTVTFNHKSVPGLPDSFEFDFSSFPRVKERLDIIAGKEARDIYGRNRVEALNHLVESDPLFGAEVEVDGVVSPLRSDNKKAEDLRAEIKAFDRIAQRLLIEEARDSEDPEMRRFYRHFVARANELEQADRDVITNTLERAGALPEFR